MLTATKKINPTNIFLDYLVYTMMTILIITTVFFVLT
jgi:hypothetical protein